MASEVILNQKKAEVKELAEKMKNAKLILLTEYRGINVADDTKLRKDLREANATCNVIKNNITRRVAVTNTCNEPVFVRVHLAIPRCLDDALPEFNASYNMLHFNFRTEDIAKGMWNWSTSMDRESGKAVKNNNWNYYTEIIDGEEYGVYVVTYESPLAVGTTTEDVIHQVYLDSKATEEDLQKIFDILRTNEWDVLVAVESTEVGEYKDPFEAFEFKQVGTYDPFEA